MDEQLVNDLYGLAPEEFVAAREALAKQLVAEGDRAAAKEVRVLRRPTVVAWAANQLVRREPAAVERLLSAGDRLREAQQGALGGAGGAQLREAMGERRSALDALVRLGVGLLGERAGAARNELSATLLAASSDPAVGEELRRGRLTREVAAGSGVEAFGGGGGGDGGDAGVPAVEPTEVTSVLAEARRRARTAAERLEAAEAEAAEATEEASVASAEAAALERALTRARASVADAEARVSSLTAAADDARREAADAEAEVERARSANEAAPPR